MNQFKLDPSFRERFNISRWAIQSTRLTICFWLAVTIAGVLAFSSLKYALFPEITFPVVVINAQTPIKTALDTETKLTIPLENPLKSLQGFRDVGSITYPGRSIINIFFDIGTNLDTATQEVKKTLDQLSFPPKTTYEVLPVNLNESGVISYALVSNDKDIDELIQTANEKIIPPLAKLPGVLKVNLLGDSSEATTEDKSSLLTRKYPTLVRFKDQDALALQVIKKSEANTLDVVSEVEKEVQKLQPQYPDIQLVLAESQAQYIREATQATIDALIGAIILAVLVIFPFLRSFRATLITALAIPIALLTVFIVMAIFGYNLETITLLALALVIGIVVDDGIVDVENIARHIDQGENPKQAAIHGTNEIGLTVTACTLSIVVVFIPVAFMGGSVGKFFQPFGLTVSAAVLSSLLVARTLSPVLAVYWLKPKRKKSEKPNYLQSPLVIHYQNLLKWSLHHRKIVVVFTVLSLIIGIALIPFIPKGFIPQLDRGEFNIIYSVPLPKRLLEAAANRQEKTDNNSSPAGFDWLSNLSKSPQSFLLRKTLRVGEKFDQAVSTIPEVASVFTVAGVRGDPTKGKIYVNLKSDRQLKTAQVQDKVREILPQVKGVSLSVEDIPFVQTEAEKPLQIAIKGDNFQTVIETAKKLETKVKNLTGLKDVGISSKDNDGKNILQIERLNGQYVSYLSANISPNVGLEDAALEIEKLAPSILPTGIILQRWGSSAQSGDVLSSFARTLILAIALMLLVLLALFGRLLEPIVVLLSFPLSIVGAMLGLLITQSAFGVISLIGLIFLVGLLDKNAILLMDYINQLRSQGKTREDAILETGAVRLRPIIMTTASTILGMLPIALGLGAGAELRQPMAVAIIGGLITSSVLSLIVVPVLYTLLEDGWQKISKQ